MPILTPEESLELFLRNNPGSTILPNLSMGDGRPAVSGEQSEDPARMRDPFDVLSGLQERFQPMVEQMFPTSGMSEEERSRLGTLMAEHERLAPLERFQPGSLGSPAMAGNPFSVDTRGAAQGIGDVVTALINRSRGRRRDEFGDELSDLQARAGADMQAHERRDEFWQEFFPELMQEEFRRDRESQTQAGRVNLENVRHENQQELENLRQEGREALVSMRDELSGDGGVSPSLVSGFSNVARNTANFFAGKAQELRRMKQDDFFDPQQYGGDIDADIQGLERKAGQAFNIASKAFSDQGGVDSSLMRELEGVLGVGDIEDFSDFFE